MRRALPLWLYAHLFLTGVVGIALLEGTARADEGMWLLTQPPLETLKKKYGFEPTSAWLEHMQKSAVHIGASGSFVSPRGLVMTNHHVGAGVLQRLSTAERNLLVTGFYAPTPADELKCPGMEVNVLWSIEDVTERVNAAAEGLNPAEGLAARKKAMTAIEQESRDTTGLDSEVVTLYQGARYRLYRYRRYTDVRLVMAPEQAIAAFGGDVDNFEYPRFALDMCFFRVYENDQPVACEHYLKWSGRGGAEGDLAFVFGHPARTQRLYTLDHLKFLRDVQLPADLAAAWRREVQLTTFGQRSVEQARVSAGELGGVQNRRKALVGLYAGLSDPRVLDVKRAAEAKLREAVQADPEKQAAWGGAWDAITRAEAAHRRLYARHRLLNDGAVFDSDLFRAALTIARLADELPKPSPDRLREYRDSELETVYHRLYAPRPISEAFEIERMTSALSRVTEALGGDDPLVLRALAGLSPAARAEQLVRGCKLQDVAVRRQLVEGGRRAVETQRDPMLDLVRLLDPDMRTVRQRYEDEVESVERDSYAKIAAAQFARFGEDVYPDATFTLRMAFGEIKGYRENGASVPAFTTLGGLYERAEQRRGVPGFELPQRWVERRDRLNLTTPLNFVCTADIIGGNSGSPVVNRGGEVIGLIFDGNLASLTWDLLYDDEKGRAVVLDARAILAALRQVYDATALVEELEGNK